ncbi:MAG: SAM-dependent chlorinase/fluorinase [Caldilineales bacterium]
MTLITLTTDFGLVDSYVAVMKGVILSIAPDAHIVDITHRITPQDVRGAAYILSTAVPYFPPDTVHVVVVDPGVGSTRRPIAMKAGRMRFVGPDNGVFTPILMSEGDASIVHLDNPAYWLPAVSHTFHGRDIFAPVGAHLAAGAPLIALGSPIDDPMLLESAQPVRLATGALRGQIVHVDRFGNLISNIPGSWLAGEGWTVRVAGLELDGVQSTYAAVDFGQLVALIASGDTLEIAVRDGSAAQRLQVAAGEPVEAWPRETGR